jgi:hypothetical protein
MSMGPALALSTTNVAVEWRLPPTGSLMVDRPISYVSARGHGDGDRMRLGPSSTTMAASDVMDAWVAVAGFGQPNDGIPNRLRGTSIPGLIL